MPRIESAPALILASLALAGCGELRVQAAYAELYAPKKEAPASTKPCPLTLQLENKRGDEVRMISERACLSTAAGGVALPT